MKNVFGFLAFLIGGYIVGLIIKNNFISGITILFFGFLLLLWTFYKKQGWFSEGDKRTKLSILLFGEIIGFILGFIGVIKINRLWGNTFIIGFAFLLLCYVIIKNFLEFLRLRKYKEKFK